MTFDPTRPFVVYRCASKEHNCGLRFTCQPKGDAPYPPPDPEAWWCVKCGRYMIMDTSGEGPQLAFLP